MNFEPLFSCQGAIAERGSAADRVACQEYQRLNLDSVARIVTEADWKPIVLDAGLQTGIFLSQATDPEVCRMDPSAMRESFRNHSVGLSTYENGYIRLSMPQTPLGEEDIHGLRKAFEHSTAVSLL